MNLPSIIDRFVTITPAALAALAETCAFTAQEFGITVDHAAAAENLLRVKLTHTRNAWRKICPPDYDATDPARIPAAMQNAAMPLDMDNGRGIFLFGKPATYKTRTIWLKLAKEFTLGKKIQHLSPHDFALKASWAMCNAEEGNAWLTSLIDTPDILFLDDVFKNRITEAQEFVLFSLVEGRMARRKPMCFTSNTHFTDIPTRLTEAGQKVRADALMRRLDESCAILNV